MQVSHDLRDFHIEEVKKKKTDKRLLGTDCQLAVPSSQKYPRGTEVCLQQADDLESFSLCQIPRGPCTLGADEAHVIGHVVCVGHCQVLP